MSIKGQSYVSAYVQMGMRRLLILYPCFYSRCNIDSDHRCPHYNNSKTVRQVEDDPERWLGCE
jgi:hypothetical protein